MNDRIWEVGRTLKDLPDSSHTYHFEYTSIHNQRIALARIIHLWHQIGFPAALIVFGFIFNIGINSGSDLIRDIALLWAASLFASAIIWFIRFYTTRILDQGIVRAYPRLVALELMLYQFWIKRAWRE